MIPYYYRILEVSPDSTHEEIRRSYRRLVMKWHPDVNKSPEAPEQFILIQKAWKTLGDPELRNNYDFYVKRYSHYSGELRKTGPYHPPPYQPKTPTYTYSSRYWPMGPPTATPEEEAKPYTKEWILVGLIILFFLTVPFISKIWSKAWLNVRHSEAIGEVVKINDGITYFFFGNEQPVTDKMFPELIEVANEMVIREGMPVKMGDRFQVIYAPGSPYINKLRLNRPDEQTYDRYCMAIWSRWHKDDNLNKLSGGTMKAVFMFALCDSVFANYGTRGLADLYFANTLPHINRYNNSETFTKLSEKEKFIEIVAGIRAGINLQLPE